MGTSYLLAKSSTTMKMYLGLLVVLAGLSMGQKGQRGKTEGLVRLGAGGQGFCPPPLARCGSCPCCLGGCVLSNCIGHCKSKKVSDDGSGGLSPLGCFPGPLPKACPPIKNLRIVNQKSSNYTRKKTFNECWTHCKELASNGLCNAWTYDTNSKGCFLYDTFPKCYNTEEYEGWISGRSFCPS